MHVRYLVVAVIGCSSAPDKAVIAAEGSGSSAPAVVVDAAVPPDEQHVVVSEPGHEPRRTLRMEPAPDARGAFTIEWSTQLVRHLAQLPVGSLHLRARVECAVFARQPNTIVGLRLAKVENVGTEDGLPAKDLERLKDAGAFFEVGDRAIPTVATAASANEAVGDQHVGTIWSAMVSDVMSAMPVWPRDPVGVGARWHVTREHVVLGVTVSDVVSFELIALEGSHATVHVTNAREAKPQMVYDSRGASADVKRFTSKGSAELTIDLAQPWPITMTREQAQEHDVSIHVSFTSNAPGLPASGDRMSVSATGKTTTTIAVDEPPKPAIVPRTDGAYCQRESASSLSCKRFLANGSWQMAWEFTKPVKSPAALVWDASRPPQRWFAFGDRVVFTFWDRISMADTLSADASKLAVWSSIDNRIESHAFVPSALP